VPSQQTTVDGVPIRWEEHGEGVPVVLLHGIPTSPELWRHVVPLLDDVRVLAFEMVGYGRSIPAGRMRDLSLSAQASYLDAWLDHLGLDRVVLAGHDLGGGVAQIAAVRNPGRCAGLFLTNAVSYDSWPIPAVKLLRAMPDVVARTPLPMLASTLATLMARGHDDVVVARESFRTHFRHYEESDGAAALARQAAALDERDTMDIADRLPGLDVPARIVWGVADQFQKPRYAERLARDLGTKPVAIRGGKHFTPEDHPEVVAAAIRDVVADAEVGAPRR
jgi:pimeloyl-ACP methyl ester carboxylesterase